MPTAATIAAATSITTWLRLVSVGRFTGAAAAAKSSLPTVAPIHMLASLFEARAGDGDAGAGDCEDGLGTFNSWLSVTSIVASLFSTRFAMRSLV